MGLFRSTAKYPRDIIFKFSLEHKGEKFRKLLGTARLTIEDTQVSHYLDISGITLKKKIFCLIIIRDLQELWIPYTVGGGSI